MNIPGEYKTNIGKKDDVKIQMVSLHIKKSFFTFSKETYIPFTSVCIHGHYIN